MIDLSAIGTNLAIGFETAFSLHNLFYCFMGVFLGTLMGVIPGIGVLVSISLLFPITFHLETTSALVMLAGIYYGTAYGGSTSAILLNVPGTPNAAVACLDGYPMAKQGRAGEALFMTTIASFVGGSVGIILMMAFAPTIASNALYFGSAEYFSLMVLGLVAASTISEGSAVKGLSMVLVGILIGLVGTDVTSGDLRYTFGLLPLADGISLVAFAMGLFGLTEIISSIRTMRGTAFDRKAITFRSMVPSRDGVRRSVLPMLRGSSVGSFFGTLPGTGSLVAAFMAYAVERKVARDPSRFGKGAVEGVVAPESANNAADQTAFIPTLTLGIPGSATMAIMLGLMIMHGVTPGPQLMTQEPSLFWGLIISFWIGNLLLLILNIPMIGIWLRLLTVPYKYLYPTIIMFVCVGVFSVGGSSFDIFIVFLFGLIGYLLRLLAFPAAPLILGFVLGPMMEEHFRRAMLYAGGDILTFVKTPVSAIILAIVLIILVWTTVSAIRQSDPNKRRLASNL